MMASTPANERSRASTVSNSQPQPQPPPNLSKEDAADFLAIDKILSHIQKVTPSDPYVLTIPQDVEPRYHHRKPEDRYQWLEHTPFQGHEHEASQYLTWHYHEPDGVYLLHSTRREEPSSRVSTPRPPAGGAKKTMSLGAYKKKVAGGTPAPEERKKQEVNGGDLNGQEKQKEVVEDKSAKKAAVKSPVERLKADEEVLAAVGDGEDIVPSAEEKKKQDGGKIELKRKRKDDTDGAREDFKRKREDSKMAGDQNGRPASEDQTKIETAKRKDEDEPPKKQIEPPATTTKADKASAPPKSEQPPAKKAKTADSDDKPPALPAGANRDKVSGDKQSSQVKKQAESSVKPASAPSKPSADSDMSLPPRLSPLRERPETNSLDDTYALPPRLSPTLPANITATLAAREQKQSKSKANNSHADDNLSTPRKALESSVAKRKSPVNGFRANSSSPMVRSDAEDPRGDSKPAAPKVRSPSPSRPGVAGRDAAALSKKDNKPKLVVKLKFKQRSNRETIRQLLRLPAKKTPNVQPSPASLKSTDARHREQRDPNAKGVAQKVGPATKSVAKKAEKSATSTPAPSEKRARGDESDAESRPAKRKKADMMVYEPPGKRKKSVPEALDLKKDTPATPGQPANPPPTPASSVKKPASQSTPSSNAPKKTGNELLAAATTSAGLKREPSHEGQGQVRTPSVPSSSPAATAATSHGQSGAAPKSTPTSTSLPPSSQPKTARQLEWQAQHDKFNSLGRELKRDCTADINAMSDKALSGPEVEDLRRLAAIKVTESLLAYFLAFTSLNEAELAAEPKQAPSIRQWRTLQDYYPFVKRTTEPYPVLQGLACMLAVVFCSRITENCVREVSGREELLTTAWTVLTRSAVDAEAKLDARTLQQTFPKAWKLGSDGVLGEEKLEPGKFAGPFKLPLGVQTKPVRAVRAAHAILREWSESKGAKYEMRIKLDE